MLKEFLKNKLLVALVAVILPVIGCESETNGQGSVDEAQSALITDQSCGETTWNLTAGRTIDVGSVIVSNDPNYLYVTYELDYPGATFGTLQVWVGNSLLNLPANTNGTPIPGQFCQSDGGACYDASGLTSYTFAIPFADLNIIDVNQACGLALNVVTHAEVSMDSNGDGQLDHETAFGGPNSGVGPRWWFYGSYAVCCDFGSPQPPVCETAYAKAGWVWTTDKRSNPEKLPSLNLTKNRWGWAINLTSTGHSEYPIWAGAGLNNTANGSLVGNLVVDWDGSTAFVKYTLSAGYYLEEVHLYAGDGKPITIAPGQYGYLDSFDTSIPQYSFTVPLSDADAVGGVWLVAHSVVCDQP